jgi:hypothetical protein
LICAALLFAHFSVKQFVSPLSNFSFQPNSVELSAPFYTFLGQWVFQTTQIEKPWAQGIRERAGTRREIVFARTLLFRHLHSSEQATAWWSHRHPRHQRCNYRLKNTSYNRTNPKNCWKR